MARPTTKIPISSIILDEEIYPRKGIDQKRVGMFAENIREGGEAIGPKQLTEDEARDTARRAYSKNTSLRSADIGKAIGRSRQTVDAYIADLRAATQPWPRHQDIPHGPPRHPAREDCKGTRAK